MKRRISDSFFTGAWAAVILCMLMSMPACAPTYPKENLPEAVREVCKIEYDMEVDVTVAGSTMGIYYPMKGLLDPGMGISEESWDKISNLLLIASRVVLSTDADIKFYCVITQDARLPELQVIIIKYVDDIKHSMYRGISRNEAFKRTLFSINLTPQARKERSIEQIFDRMGIAEETKQKVLDEFFRSPPTRLSDIGYWRGNFYLKDVTLEEFLASQIANRIKIDFKGEKKLEKFFTYKTAEGLFNTDEKARTFLIMFKIADAVGSEPVSSLRREKIKTIIDIASEVVKGYKFKDFDLLVLDDQLENVRVSVKGQDVCDFADKKLSVENVAYGPAGYFEGQDMSEGM
ncbi:MAG: hypothetical protein ABIA77_06605 [Candidatus Omnitrophota bacterium]